MRLQSPRTRVQGLGFRIKGFAFHSSAPFRVQILVEKQVKLGDQNLRLDIKTTI
jgi:hypothetical protein